MMLKLLIKLAASVISVVPPIVTAACYFPLWIARGAETVLSGFGLFIAIVAFVPLMKLIGRALASPSAPVMWLVLFLLFLGLSAIADEMVVISFVGTVSNIVGAVIFKLAERKASGENELV